MLFSDSEPSAPVEAEKRTLLRLFVEEHARRLDIRTVCMFPLSTSTANVASENMFDKHPRTSFAPNVRMGTASPGVVRIAQRTFQMCDS